MTASFEVKIYHNPACGTSRNTLALIRNTGIEPTVIEYLITPPSHDELIKLIQNANLTVREAIRQNVDPYRDLELDRPDLSDEQLLSFMLEHPILINRPIVVTDKGAALCRPAERVFALLANPVSSFTKENGEVINHSNR